MSPYGVPARKRCPVAGCPNYVAGDLLRCAAHLDPTVVAGVSTVRDPEHKPRPNGIVLHEVFVNLDAAGTLRIAARIGA